MSDRELLELAAKTAGMDYLVWTPGASPIVPTPQRIGGRMAWNPIHNDGDALRLAVKLGLLVSQQLSYVSVCQPHGNASMRGVQFQEPYGTDPIAATRRAIVRAAAAIAEAREA